jgi:hypothetical protein
MRLPESVAHRLGQLTERRARLALEIAARERALADVAAELRQTLAAHGVPAGADVIVEPGAALPVGTVVDAQGRPLPDPETSETDPLAGLAPE